MTKEKADLDEWCKTIAPSTELRKWYHHDPERFTEFTRRYREELTQPERAEALAQGRRHQRGHRARRDAACREQGQVSGPSPASADVS